MALWNKITYPRRLFLWLLGYSLLLVGCFISFQYHREKEFKQEQLNTRLQVINKDILSNLYRGDSIESTFSNNQDLRISIIRPDGKIEYDNNLDTNIAENHYNREEIAKARTKGEGYTIRRHSQSTGLTYFYSATRGKDGIIVRSAVPYTTNLKELLQADMNFIWIMGAITLLMCIGGYIATHKLGKHIQRLNNFAEKAEKGERIYDTTPFPNDELGSISNHIVRLYASLQKAIADRDNLHKAALHEQEEKERIKKQLTNNINHELKTPVASIQACIETILNHPEMQEDKKTDFLLRSQSNVERLKHLLNDVALITRIDDAPTSISKESLNLTKIIQEVAEEYEPIAENKGITIDNGIIRPIPIEGNASLLASVFRNLIQNAIAYSGCDTVTIKLEQSSTDKTVISVSDNGCGVASVHLSHLFERFYRIDKGRSRSAGGTGLGLSIVKNAVMMHNGSITVDNQLSGGLIFTITFNKK